jgi:hypothetical protein
MLMSLTLASEMLAFDESLHNDLQTNQAAQKISSDRHEYS